MVNSLQYADAVSFFTTPLVHATTSTIPTNNPFLYFSHFSTSCSTSLLDHKTIQTMPTNTPFLYTQSCSQFRLCQGSNEQGSFVRTDTILISSCFTMDRVNSAQNLVLKQCSNTTFILFCFRKLIYQSSFWWRCLL